METIFESLPFSQMVIAGFFAYLMGSLSTAIILCKLFNLPDPRSLGSNNPGATNVARFAGKKIAFFTLLGDMLKAVIPVFIVQNILKLSDPVIAFTAFAAFLGHLYPIFFKFQGGKGVATALGIILTLSPLLGGCALLVWILTFKITKISSLSALVAAATCPIILTIFNLTGLIKPSVYILVSLIFIVIFLIIRHKENIKRLYSGKEDNFNKKSEL